jgi:hypothetical protein
MHIFIISWANQHENAAKIARQLNGSSYKVSIVYSDPAPNPVINTACNLIRRPNHLFWGDKFLACLESSDNSDILVIHADCTCDDWLGLARSCQETVRSWPIVGVWSPQIDYVPFDIGLVSIGPLTDTTMNVVAWTDGVVFYLAPPIVKRMKTANYQKNIYGWGIDWMFTCAAYCRGMIAVIDTSIKVLHPRTYNSYSRLDAHNQFHDFMRQLTLSEEVHRRLLNSIIANNEKTNIKQ